LIFLKFDLEKEQQKQKSPKSFDFGLS